MSKAVLEKMILEETKDLSFETLSEILDFIQFLKVKKSANKIDKSFSESIGLNLAELNQTSLIHLEKEFENYKETYPHE